MIELTQINSLLRNYQKDSTPNLKRKEVESSGGGTRKDKGDSVELPDSVQSTAPIEEYSTVINFEYVVSGKIHLNREAREHIVDFFQ